MCVIVYVAKLIDIVGINPCLYHSFLGFQARSHHKNCLKIPISLPIQSGEWLDFETSVKAEEEIELNAKAMGAVIGKGGKGPASGQLHGGWGMLGALENGAGNLFFD